MELWDAHIARSKKREGTMRLLFEIDNKNYDPAGVGIARPSARCVTIRGGKVAMLEREAGCWNC